MVDENHDGNKDEHEAKREDSHENKGGNGDGSEGMDARNEVHQMKKEEGDMKKDHYHSNDQNRHNASNHNHSKHNHSNHNHQKHNHPVKHKNSNHDDSDYFHINLNGGKIAENCGKVLGKIKKGVSGNHWVVSTIVLAVVLLFVIFSSSPVATGGVIGEKKAGDIIIQFAEAQGLGAELVDVVFEDGLYKVTIIIEDQDVPVYLTGDGKNLVPSVIPIADALSQVQPPAGSPPAAAACVV